MMPVISIVIPVVRPDSARRCTLAIERCGAPTGHRIELIVKEDLEGIGCPYLVRDLVAISTGDFICFLGDDTEPQDGWLHAAMRVMYEQTNDKGLVGLNDGSNHPFATHWVASRSLLPQLDGEFFHTGYKHCYCDVELTARCRELGLYSYSEKAKIIHHNPFIDASVPRDEFYDRAYSPEVTNHDRELYYNRKENGWKTI